MHVMIAVYIYIYIVFILFSCPHPIVLVINDKGLFAGGKGACLLFSTAHLGIWSLDGHTST